MTPQPPSTWGLWARGGRGCRHSRRRALVWSVRSVSAQTRGTGGPVVSARRGSLRVSLRHGGHAHGQQPGAAHVPSPPPPTRGGRALPRSGPVERGGGVGPCACARMWGAGTCGEAVMQWPRTGCTSDHGACPRWGVASVWPDLGERWGMQVWKLGLEGAALGCVGAGGTGAGLEASKEAILAFCCVTPCPAVRSHGLRAKPHCRCSCVPLSSGPPLTPISLSRPRPPMPQHKRRSRSCRRTMPSWRGTCGTCRPSWRRYLRPRTRGCIVSLGAPTARFSVTPLHDPATPVHLGPMGPRGEGVLPFPKACSCVVYTLCVRSDERYGGSGGVRPAWVSTRIAAAWGPRPRATAGGCACPFASSTDARGQGTPTIGACGTGGRRRSVCVRAHVGGGDMWGGSDAMAPHRLHL